jgi:hypothetical protein
MALGIIKPKICLDASVPSACLDSRTPERQALTLEFWRVRLPHFDPHVSKVLITEVNNTPELKRRMQLIELVSSFPVLPATEQSDRLLKAYIKQGAFAEDCLADAEQVAIAVANRIGYLLSWNYRHLVKDETRQQVNLINLGLGYEAIKIFAPPEL